ncbi:MAG: recombination-associated protein RdgC, partial [Ottowia sp.]
ADGLFDKDGQSDNRDERFDADAALATGELSRLIPDLIEALGGEMNEMGEPGSAAPAATPAAAAAVQAGEDAGPPF